MDLTVNYSAAYINAAVEVARSVHKNAPADIVVTVEGDTDDGLRIDVENKDTGNTIRVPLDGRLHDREKRAVSYLMGNTPTVPEGTSLVRPVPWYETYTPTKYNRVRLAALRASAAAMDLLNVIPVKDVLARANQYGAVTVHFYGELVEIPKDLVDDSVVLAADAWLRGDDRVYETTKPVLGAPRHYQNGECKGIPKLDL
jgi:hypothetical protein|nr:MAG TPA: hypothetical protein [Caudoviricetes sp.]